MEFELYENYGLRSPDSLFFFPRVKVELAKTQPSRKACLATAEVGSHGAVLTRRRAVPVDELNATRHALELAAEQGWLLFRDGGATCFVAKAGVRAISEWVETGKFPNGDSIRPEIMAKIRPRFGGSTRGLFLETYQGKP